MTVREIRRVMNVVLGALLLVILVCVGILLSPLAKSRSQREADLQEMQAQFKDKERELGPSHGIDNKIGAAAVDIGSFYKDRLPAQYSQIDTALVKAGQDSGVQLQGISFKAEKKMVDDLQRVDILLTISGPYVNDVKFINAVERNKVFFVISSVQLGGSSNGVQLQVKAETYLKTGAA
ncbi:hypothetical protein Acid345_1578 [Candidatus Koribacter versatilis Ellin345]|uniref:General secretion pathway protein M n=1 Tax=Koribacter versatilis (strain Ellin345) TaxID=204669 RepID=Q1IRC0_KORVE|nr:hypothetical protein [Candidatus Koribacter versatilis]ABF40580.1 hypothetical protein Acid345_1578 [Candidatus Koribacter versatilis Ellin345]